MLLGMLQFPSQKNHCYEGFVNMLVILHSAQHNLVKHRANILLLSLYCNQNNLVWSISDAEVGYMQHFLILSFPDILLFKLLILSSFFLLFFKDMWKDFSEDNFHYAKCQIKVIFAVPKQLTSLGSNHADFLHTLNYRHNCWHWLLVRFLNTFCLNILFTVAEKSLKFY